MSSPFAEQTRPLPEGGAERALRSAPRLGRAKSAAKTKRNGSFRLRRKGAFGFLAPWLLGLLGLTTLPMFASLYLSFTDYDLLTSPTWVGIDNYVRMFTEDARYLKSLRVTLFYVGVSVPLKLAAALAAAMLLRRTARGVGFYRALFYLPSILGSSVAIAMLWRQIFGTNGLVNQFGGMIGVEQVSWISHPDYAIWVLIALSVWQFGTPMVIFLAGLTQIPEELYEAADVDGASRLRKFWHVTLPMLSPVILFNLIFQIIISFRSFTPAAIISGGTGGPVDSTLLYTLYLYKRGFTQFDMGYASAMAWILLALIAAATTLAFKVTNRFVFYMGDS